MQMIIIRIAIKATTPPTIPIIRVSSLVIGCLICGSFVRIFAEVVVCGTLQIISGSGVVVLVIIFDVDLMIGDV
jgi:hypothetical protein